MDINVRVTVDNAVLCRLDKLIEVLGNCITQSVGSTPKVANAAKPEKSIEKAETAKSSGEETAEKAEALAADESVTYSKDDVVMILQSLAKKKGDKSVSKTLLEQFGASKVSDLKTEDYGAIIIAAEEMM